MSTSQAAPTVSWCPELCACASGSSQDKKCPHAHPPRPEQPSPPALEPWLALAARHCSHPRPALTCLHLGKEERHWWFRLSSLILGGVTGGGLCTTTC